MCCLRSASCGGYQAASPPGDPAAGVVAASPTGRRTRFSAQDFSPAHLRRAVEGSLRRLGTDYLDLFQLHSPSIAVVETPDWIEVLEALKGEGKIRYYGVSCDSSTSHSRLFVTPVFRRSS